MKELTVGIVGCGVNSDKHLQVYSSLQNVRLVAVYDTDLAKAHEKGRSYGVEEVPKDYDSMLRLDLDLIDIVTSTHTHSQLAILALEAGHNVLVEKPMAVSSKQCQMMIDAARKGGRTLCVNHNKRFYESVRQTKSTVEREGLLASRMSVRHFYAHPYPGFRQSWIFTEESGGILWESMVHDVYLAEYLLGKTESVYASANKLKEAVFDSITLVLRNKYNVAVCETQWNIKEPLEVLQLVTKEGDHFSANLPHDLLLRKSRQYRDRRTTIMRTLYDDIHDPLLKWTRHMRNLIVTGSYQMALPFERTFFVVIKQYISYLNGSAPSPPVTAEEGLRSIKVLEAARRSIASDKLEYVD